MRAVACAVLAASLLGAIAAPETSAPPPAPTGDAFYVPPAPLPPGDHGDVIWSRPLAGGLVLASALVNTLVLYRTVAPDGRDVAVSGTIAIPRGAPPAQGWPVLSWAHGTTGNAPQCAPTRDRDDEYARRYLDGWVARGFAVVQTDYEGQGTPGLHPYLVRAAAAHDVTDIVRAARRLYPAIGTRWFAFGFSEGGAAALSTAADGPAWAPELRLEGAVSFAPASHLAAALHAMLDVDRPIASLPYMLEMIEGIGSTDPAIHLNDLLTPQASGRLPELQRRCADVLMNDPDFMSLHASDVFRPGVDLTPLLVDFQKNEANRIRTNVPILLVQGGDDHVVSPRATAYVDREFCANGIPVTFETFPNAGHGTIVTDSLGAVETWVDARLANPEPPAAPATNC